MRARPLAGSERGGALYKLLVFAAIAGALLVLYSVRAPVLRGFAEWWVVDEELQESQAIVVLGGDSIFGDRVRHAVELHRRGWGPRLLLSGITLRANFNETELMRREAVDLGMAEKDLLLMPHNAASTIEEALVLRRVLAEERIRRVVVVTSNFHTRRARWVMHEVLRDAGIEVKLSAASDVRFDPRRWWERRQSRNLFLLELLKVPNTWWELGDVPAAPSEPEPSRQD